MMPVIVLLVASAVMGDWILRLFRLQGGVDVLLYRLFAGLCGCAVLMLAIGSVSISVAQFVMNLFAVMGLGFELFFYSRTKQPLLLPRRDRTPLSFVEGIAAIAITAGLALTLISALAPATGWDACVAHLALPKDYVREGRIELIPGNEYSAYPQWAHCLFAYAFAQGGESAVMLLSWTFALMACAAAFDLGRRIEGRACGLIAAAILATSPIFLDQGGTASLDMAFCGFTLAALACFTAWHHERHSGWLLLSALLAGSSCGIRHTGYIVCALLIVASFVASGGQRKAAFVAFSFISLVAALPWLIRSAILVGNPVYPFFAEWLSPADMEHWNVTAVGTHASIQGTTVMDLLRFPIDLVLRPHRYDGWAKSPGGLVLFLGLPGLFVGGRRARMLGAFSASGFVGFFFFERLARYLLPFFAPMMIVAAVAACRLKALRHGIAALLAATFVYGLALDVGAVHFKLPVVFGAETRDDYLLRRVERYEAFQWINDHLPPEATVFSFDRRTYFLKGRSYQNDEPLRRMQHESVRDQVDWLRAHGIRYVLIPVTYIEETAGYRDAFQRMTDDWLHFRRYFTPVQSFDLPRPRGEGTERVEILQVNAEDEVRENV